MDQNKEIQKSIDALKNIAAQIQASEALATFQEEEDEDSYKALVEEFEAPLMELHVNIANHFPLNLEAFETEFLNPDLEGLLLPRLLGFSVLRGYHDKIYKYLTPQDHFKNLLIAIAESPNFDYIKNRIGQTVQIGFALSSDIWITNLLEGIENKKYTCGYKLRNWRNSSMWTTGKWLIPNTEINLSHTTIIRQRSPLPWEN